MGQSWFRTPVISGSLFSLLLVLGLPWGCENEPTVQAQSRECSVTSDCAEGQFCNIEGRCQNQCASCGKDCDTTDDCPRGQYCDESGSCQKQCEPGDDGPCGAKRVCSDDGMCIADDDIDFNVGGAGGIGGDGDQECIDVEVEFTPRTPNVVLLLDHSGSMGPMSPNDDFDDNVARAIEDGSYEPWDCGDDYDWRWNVARNVLLHPENGVVRPLQDKVRFGTVSYTSEGDSCPLLEKVEIGFEKYDEILAEFECSEAQGVTDTPTRESLTLVAEDLAAMDLEGPKVIVLVTDGEPDTCQCRNWDAGSGPTCASTEENQVERGGMLLSPAQAEQYDVIVEAQRIHEELGITIEVINMSSASRTELAQHLDQVAARGGAVSGASIPGFRPEALTEAFTSIIDGVRSCAIDLDGKIAKGKESTGTVRLDRDPSDAIDWEELELGAPDGWKVNSPTQIELVGDACETIKSGNHELDISFPCESFEVIPR